MEISKGYNKELCRKYPFLIPRNEWTGRRITDGAGFWPDNPDTIPQYDWEYTLLDQMPDGWRIAFGEQMCAELKAALDHAGITDEYMILQIKEKFGMLCWYDNGNTSEGHEIIQKYEEISQRTCIRCGQPATMITIGWISPFCDACVPVHNGRKNAVPIDEFFSKLKNEIV